MMLNCKSSFLLDITNTNFIISKRLYYTRFKLNVVIFPRTLPPGSPLNPLRGSQWPQTPSYIYFPIHAKRRIFFLPGSGQAVWNMTATHVMTYTALRRLWEAYCCRQLVWLGKMCLRANKKSSVLSYVSESSLQKLFRGPIWGNTITRT